MGKREAEREGWRDRREIIDEYKYLGIVMNSNGNFKTCQEQICQQGRRAMYSLITKCRKFFNLSIDLQLELFDAMVLPSVSHWPRSSQCAYF